MSKDKKETKQVEDSTETTESRKRPTRRKVYERFSASDIPQDVQEHFAKDGYELRFVRYMLNGELDNASLTKREREGYEYVTKNEVPSDYLRTLRVKDIDITTGLVTNGSDLCLMKIDSELRQSRREYYEGVTDREVNSVDVHVLEKKHGLKNVGSKSKTMLREPTFRD